MHVQLAITCLGLAAAASSGCQSTQATSAEREAEGKQLLGNDKGLVVNRENPDIEVLDTTLIDGDGSDAVVVELKNTSDQAMANVPILIDVRDAKGKTVFKNDLAGLEPALTQIPLIAPGETFDWVNNQVLATGEPDSVKVKVGTSEETVGEDLPEVDVSDPKLQTDQVSGVEATGTAENKSDVEQEDITLYAVARKDGKIVAAGRGVLKRLQPNGEKAANYHIFFIGDPEGADITVTAPPSVLR
ncbi:MAG: hypothetical protein H0V25_09345 [Solirubrobacterales bacterium]|nr:hypothetical protein [Solirubrobacterales bacterium]